MRIDSGSTKLTDGIANRIFGDPGSVGGSVAIAAILRAIVLRRDGATTDNLKAKTEVWSIKADDKDDIRSIFGQAKAVTVMYTFKQDLHQSEFPIPDGWREVDRERHPAVIYTKQVDDTRIFINDVDRKVVAFTHKSPSILWVQAFAGCLLSLMKWYYPSVANTPADEIEFFKGLGFKKGEQRPDEELKALIIGFVNKIADECNFTDNARTLYIRESLSDYFDRTRLNRLKQKEREEEKTSQRINELMEEVGRLYVTLDGLRVDLRGLRVVPSSSSDEIVKFFEDHKQISLLDFNTDNGTIRYGVDDTLEYYDVDLLEEIIDNDESFLYDHEDDTVELIKAIFVENKGIIRTNSVFTLNAGGLVSPERHGSFVDDSMPQPHINFYACSGGNSTYYKQYADRGEWDMAIEQSIAATKNLNFGDSTVCEKMLEWIEDHMNTKFIYTPDLSRLMSGNEFLAYLKGE